MTAFRQMLDQLEESVKTRDCSPVLAPRGAQLSATSDMQLLGGTWGVLESIVPVAATFLSSRSRGPRTRSPAQPLR